MLNKGKIVAYGDLNWIKEKFQAELKIEFN